MFQPGFDDAAVHPVEVVLADQNARCCGWIWMPGSANRTLPSWSSLTMRNGAQDSASGRANSQVKNDADACLSCAKTMAWFRETGTDAPFGAAPPRPMPTATGARRRCERNTSAGGSARSRSFENPSLENAAAGGPLRLHGRHLVAARRRVSRHPCQPQLYVARLASRSAQGLLRDKEAARFWLPILNDYRNPDLLEFRGPRRGRFGRSERCPRTRTAREYRT